MAFPLTVPLSDGTGVVAEFDEDRGIGLIQRDDGTNYPFQCLSIADGTRTIPVGVSVAFSVAAGRMGKWEATSITTITE